MSRREHGRPTRLADRRRPSPGSTGCPRCGRAETSNGEVISTHDTSDGLITWVRCPCGGLQLWLDRDRTGELLTRGPSRASA